MLIFSCEWSFLANSDIYFFRFTENFKLSGPVRNLHCTYNDREYIPFKCSWKIPFYSNGIIRYYNIKVTHEGQEIYNGKINIPFVLLDVNLTYNGLYNVSVTPVTLEEGRTASTNVVFQEIGKISFF